VTTPSGESAGHRAVLGLGILIGPLRGPCTAAAQLRSPAAGGVRYAIRLGHTPTRMTRRPEEAAKTMKQEGVRSRLALRPTPDGIAAASTPREPAAAARGGPCTPGVKAGPGPRRRPPPACGGRLAPPLSAEEPRWHCGRPNPEVLSLTQHSHILGGQLVLPPASPPSAEEETSTLRLLEDEIPTGPRRARRQKQPKQVTSQRPGGR